MSKIRYFEEWLRQNLGKLQKEKRWKNYDKEGKESVLEHSVKMAWIIQILLAYEEKGGNIYELNSYQLLQCAVNHDLAETIVGDIPDPDKTTASEDYEKCIFADILDSGIPDDVRGFFPLPMNWDLEVPTIHRMFWRGAEIIGYMMYALAEFRQGNEAYKEVIERCYEDLCKMGSIYDSIDLMATELWKAYVNLLY